VPDLMTLSVLVIVALSPLLRRIYMQRFWIRGQGTVIRLEGGISTIRARAAAHGCGRR